ncbi:MAG: hypothetical protein IAF38_17380 [Bacteroidia bacterium]|nr:hypothetical protein [Bacteroidia bacterium]
MTRIIGFIFAALILFSCKPKTDFSAEITQADSVKKEIQRVVTGFNQLDSVRISVSENTIGAYLGYITQNLKDTISREDAFLLSGFKGIKKSFGKYSKTKRDLGRFYAFNLKQIESLQTDLKEGMIDNKDSAKKYITSEIDANRELMRMMRLHTEIIPNEITRYDSLKPKVEEIIKKINKGTLPAELLNVPVKRETQEVEDDD